MGGRGTEINDIIRVLCYTFAEFSFVRWIVCMNDALFVDPALNTTFF